MVPVEHHGWKSDSGSGRYRRWTCANDHTSSRQGTPRTAAIMVTFCAVVGCSCNVSDHLYNVGWRLCVQFL